GLPEHANCWKALGYREIRRLVRGEIDEAEARTTIVRETRQYAKRQMTWFRSEPEVEWFEHAGEPPRVAIRAWAAPRLDRAPGHLGEDDGCPGTGGAYERAGAGMGGGRHGRGERPRSGRSERVLQPGPQVPKPDHASPEQRQEAGRKDQVLRSLHAHPRRRRRVGGDGLQARDRDHLRWGTAALRGPPAPPLP